MSGHYSNTQGCDRFACMHFYCFMRTNPLSAIYRPLKLTWTLHSSFTRVKLDQGDISALTRPFGDTPMAEDGGENPGEKVEGTGRKQQQQ